MLLSLPSGLSSLPVSGRYAPNVTSILNFDLLTILLLDCVPIVNHGKCRSPFALSPLSLQPGEDRRTHQWSFKPSAATVLSHAAVFLPARSRYVGVQQGSTLVSWRESEQDVKRPRSSQVCVCARVCVSGCVLSSRSS